MHRRCKSAGGVAVDWSPTVILGCVGAASASFGAGALACGWLLRAYCERGFGTTADSPEHCDLQKRMQCASHLPSRTAHGLELLDARRKLQRENQATRLTQVSAERVRFLDVRRLRAEAPSARGPHAR